jgi:hypothetical protein
MYQQRAADYRAHADTLREGILQSMQMRSAPEDDGRLAEAYEASRSERQPGGAGDKYR